MNELKNVKNLINAILINYPNFKIIGNLLDRHNSKGDRQQEVICKIGLNNYPFWNHVMYLKQMDFLKQIRKLKSENSQNKYIRDLQFKFI